VCIIEDDDSLRRALQRLLRSVGWEVETFATAEEFLESPQMTRACLILDQHLPGLSGLELQARLKADNQAVAVVFISAYAEEQVRRQALAAGAVAFLQKPFEEQALLNVVGRALRTETCGGRESL
jgi:FixJ family two-component response regulator